MYLNRI